MREGHNIVAILVKVLYAVVVVIDDIDSAGSIDGDVGYSTEMAVVDSRYTGLTKRGQILPAAAEHLDAVVVRVGDIDRAIACHGHADRTVKLIVARASVPPSVATYEPSASRI